MKFLVERDVLRDALSVVIGRTKSTSHSIPILTHILIEAEGQTVKLTGNDLDSCSQVTVKAEVSAAGVIAIPADRLSRLVAGLGEGAQVMIEADDVQAKVRAGRSTYQFQLMSPDQFPASPVMKDTTKFKITAKQAGRLFGSPAGAICDESSRYYLCGIYLHQQQDKRLGACATNGHILIKAAIDTKPPAFQGVIVPGKSCAEIVRLANGEDVEFEVSPTLIAIETGNRRFVSKLIDGTFPDYNRVMPSATAPLIAVESKELDAALTRLVAAHDPKIAAAVKLSWRDDVEHISASLRSQFGDGEEQIECDCPGRNPGEVGARVDYLRTVIDALGGARLRLFIDGPGDPMRLENPDDADVIAVVMPCGV